MVIDRGDLDGGVYFYVIKSNQQIIKTGKFIFE